MKFKVLIAAILFALVLPVAAQQQARTKAYEISVADLRLPQSEAGTLGFKPCDDCSYLTMRVDGNTEWVFDTSRMSLEKFRRSLSTVTDRANTPATVMHHLDGDSVIRVSVHPVRQASD